MCRAPASSDDSVQGEQADQGAGGDAVGCWPHAGHLLPLTAPRPLCGYHLHAALCASLQVIDRRSQGAHGTAK